MLHRCSTVCTRDSSLENGHPKEAIGDMDFCMHVLDIEVGLPWILDIESNARKGKLSHIMYARQYVSSQSKLFVHPSEFDFSV